MARKVKVHNKISTVNMEVNSSYDLLSSFCGRSKQKMIIIEIPGNDRSI